MENSHTHKILSENKLKATPQRILVYSMLSKSDNHLSADNIFEKIKKTMPAISFATIYAILRTFKDVGLINELRINSERSLFESRIDGHHHFYCEKCKKVFDINIPHCCTLEKKEVNGHIINNFEGYFHGFCKKCKKIYEKI